MSSRTGKQSPFPALQEGGLDFKVLALSILPGATQKVKWLLQTSLGFERRSPRALGIEGPRLWHAWDPGWNLSR